MKPRPPTATLFPYTTLFRSRLRVLGEGRTPWRHRVRPAEDGVPREKARGAVGTRVAHAEVIVERAADVEPCRAVSRDAPGVTDRRREPAFDEAMNEHVVGRAIPGGHRLVQERQ